MIRNFTLLILLFYSLLLINSCGDDLGPCSAIDPKCNCISFTLVDSMDHVVLGQSNPYPFDSISISLSNDSIFLSPVLSRNTMNFNYNSWDDQKTYSLNISKSKQYPIHLFISRKTSECGNYKVLDSLYFNNKRVNIKDGLYRFRVN